MSNKRKWVWTKDEFTRMKNDAERLPHVVVERLISRTVNEQIQWTRYGDGYKSVQPDGVEIHPGYQIYVRCSSSDLLPYLVYYDNNKHEFTKLFEIIDVLVRLRDKPADVLVFDHTTYIAKWDWLSNHPDKPLFMPHELYKPVACEYARKRHDYTCGVGSGVSLCQFCPFGDFSHGKYCISEFHEMWDKQNHLFRALFEKPNLAWEDLPNSLKLILDKRILLDTISTLARMMRDVPLRTDMVVVTK